MPNTYLGAVSEKFSLRTMADISDVTRNGDSLSKVQKLWREVKEWRIHWRWSHSSYYSINGGKVDLIL